MPSLMPSSARCVGREPLMRGRGGMRDQALGVAEIVADLDDAQRVLEAERFRLAAGDLERDQV